MNEIDSYILECYRDDKKISGIKLKKINLIQQHSNASLYAMAKGVEVPKCKICENDVKLDKKRNFTSFCGMTCQKIHMSETNKLKNCEFNKKKSKEKQNFNFDKLKSASHFYKNNTPISMIEVSKIFGLSYFLFRKYMLENDLVDSGRSRESFIENTKLKMNHVNTILSDEDWLETKKDEKVILKDISAELGVSKNYIAKILRDNNTPYPRFNTSSYENMIQKYLTDNNINFERGNRKILNGLELDFYIKDYNIAIEVNGNYYHQTKEGFKDKNYHMNKTNICEDKNIRLIHIFEHEFINNYEKIEHMLNSAFNINTKIYARKCIIKEISYIEFSSFCNENHLQGSVPSSVRYGLFIHDDLIAVMGFCKSRYDKKIDYEITRYCSSKNITVVGGASKLFKNFTKYHKNKSIISYCNRQYFTGNMYLKLGMQYSHTTPPNYIWCSSDLKTIKTRYQTQKHKLGSGIPEKEHMFLNKYMQVHDSGQKVFIYKG